MNHNDHHQTHLKCTVCEHDIEIPEHARDGDRITCPNCFAQLKLIIDKGRKHLRCAVCGNPMLKECPDDCERKTVERERRGFFDVKL